MVSRVPCVQWLLQFSNSHQETGHSTRGIDGTRATLGTCSGLALLGVVAFRALRINLLQAADLFSECRLKNSFLSARAVKVDGINRGSRCIGGHVACLTVGSQGAHGLHGTQSRPLVLKENLINSNCEACMRPFCKSKFCPGHCW